MSGEIPIRTDLDRIFSNADRRIDASLGSAAHAILDHIGRRARALASIGAFEYEEVQIDPDSIQILPIVRIGSVNGIANLHGVIDTDGILWFCRTVESGLVDRLDYRTRYQPHDSKNYSHRDIIDVNGPAARSLEAVRKKFESDHPL